MLTKATTNQVQSALDLMNKDFFAAILSFLPAKKVISIMTVSKVFNIACLIAMKGKLPIHFPHYVPKAIENAKVKEKKSSLQIYQANHHNNMFKQAYDLDYKSVEEKPEKTVKFSNHVVKVFEIAKEDNIDALNALFPEHITLKDFITHQDMQEGSPLFWAKKNKSQRVLDFIYKNLVLPLFNKKDIHFADEYQNTLLHWAVLCNQSVDVVQKLIASGAEINATNSEGNTALHAAVSIKNQFLINHLLSYDKINLNIQNKKGVTAAYLAAENNDVATLQKLQTKQADIHLTMHAELGGDSPLHAAARNDSVEAIEFYLKSGADVNLVCSNNETAIYFACEKGNIKAVKRLLKEPGIDINQINKKSGVNALFIATQNNHFETVKLLLSSNKIKNINEQFKLNATVLFMAAKIGAANLCTLLISFGADRTAKLSNGKSIMQITSSNEVKAALSEANSQKSFKFN